MSYTINVIFYCVKVINDVYNINGLNRIKVIDDVYNKNGLNHQAWSFFILIFCIKCYSNVLGPHQNKKIKDIPLAKSIQRVYYVLVIARTHGYYAKKKTLLMHTR